MHGEVAGMSGNVCSIKDTQSWRGRLVICDFSAGACNRIGTAIA
jgi:hypothetical protein